MPVSYLDVIKDALSEAPGSTVEAPLPVIGKPGDIGVQIAFPRFMPDGTRCNQYVRFALSPSKIFDEGIIRARCASAIDCRDNLIVSVFGPPSAGDALEGALDSFGHSKQRKNKVRA